MKRWVSGARITASLQGPQYKFEIFLIGGSSLHLNFPVHQSKNSPHGSGNEINYNFHILQ